MADISKITDINGNTYNIKDAVARAYTAPVSSVAGKTGAVALIPTDVGVTISTTDLTAGTSALTTGTIYLVYE